MPARPRLLSLGDRVRYDGREHTVAALHGTSVRLVDDSQAVGVVLLGHLLASEGFAVLSTALSRPPLPEAGVLEGLPEEAAQRAEWWRRHLSELLTGRPDGDAGSPVRAEYDPTVHSLRQRELAKVAELRDCGEAVGLSTLRRMRSRFENEGVAGLVDGRLRKPATGTSRADSRVVDAIAKVVGSRTDEPTVSAQVLRRRVERLLVAEHGAGAVRMPSRAAFYRLLEAVSTGQHLFGSARTRRSLGRQPKRMFGQLTAARPGEVMEIDSTPLDVMVIHDDGTVDRCELTGLIDLATRTLAAVVLRPSTKAVDAALLLARAMTPEPVRPGWSDVLRMSRSVLPYASFCYEQTSRFWTTLMQHGYRISDLTQRLVRLRPRPARTVRPWDPKRYAAIYPEIVKAMVFYAAPHWRGLALSGADEDFWAFHAECIRRLPNESSLRTTAKPWFIHQLRMIAHTIEEAAAPGNHGDGSLGPDLA